MTTAVGLQIKFESAVKDLIELDFDAVEAYTAAIERLENKEFAAKLSEFKTDHERHIKELSELLRKHGEEPPSGPSMIKQWLAKGKVIIAELAGDEAILIAMRSNEQDTNTAYQRVSDHKGIWADAVDIIRRGLNDEKRHKAWIESQLDKQTA